MSSQVCRVVVCPAEPREIQASIQAAIGAGVRLTVVQGFMVPLTQGRGSLMAVSADGRPDVIPGILLLLIGEVESPKPLVAS